MQKLTLSKASIARIIGLLVLLVLVRVFEKQLFYDPFLSFFKGEAYSYKLLPQYDVVKLFLSLFFRYAVNTILSLGVLWLAFRDRSVIRLSAILYTIFFTVLGIALFALLFLDKPNMLMLFYIRRFLIQPIFLILFVPAFYYQKKG